MPHLVRIDRMTDSLGRLRYYRAVLSGGRTAAIGQATLMHLVRLPEAIQDQTGAVVDLDADVVQETIERGQTWRIDRDGEQMEAS